MKKDLFLGFDIGGTKCAVVLGDEEGNVLAKERFATLSVEETLGRLFQIAEGMEGYVAVGISCGGPLNSKEGVILSPPNLPGWDRIEIVRMTEERLGVPAFLCNDANAGAVAEWRFGAGRGCRNMIFMTFGTGLGAGLILDGRLYAGTNDYAGEAGHLRLEKDGPIGYGKRGSFEGFCSGSGIAQLGRAAAREALAGGGSPAFCPNVEALELVDAKRVAEAAYAGDATALEVFRTCGEYLGRGCSLLVDLFNPERIVIGSIFARCENLLREPMEKVLREETLPGALEVCRVVPAELGERIGDVAALSVAVDGWSRRQK